MCAAVLSEVRSWNMAWTDMVWATGSMVTRAVPVPGDKFGGCSFGPERVAKKMIGAAAAGAARTMRKTKPNRNRRMRVILLGSLVVANDIHKTWIVRSMSDIAREKVPPLSLLP